jgi:hypothetical protein
LAKEIDGGRSRKVARGGKTTMKSALFAFLAGFVLVGCQSKMTLEEAQALCTKKGGLLVVIYTQQITASGAGPQIASPGNCVSPSKFDITPPASDGAPVPAN